MGGGGGKCTHSFASLAHTSQTHAHMLWFLQEIIIIIETTSEIFSYIFRQIENLHLA